MNGFVVNAQILPSANGSEIELYGVLEDGREFVWRQEKPWFIMMASPSLDAGGQRVTRRQSNAFRSLDGRKLDVLHFDGPESLRQGLLSLPKDQTFEADVDPCHRFLMEKRILGWVTLPGAEGRKGRPVDLTGLPLQPGRATFPLRWLSIDIETGVESNRLYSVAFHMGNHDGKGEVRQVFLLGDPEKSRGEHRFFATEAEILEEILAFTAEHRPQVFIGWNVTQFDFDYLLEKYRQFGIEPRLGVGDRPVDAFKSKAGDLYLKIPGRAVVDGMNAMRLTGLQPDGWSLENVSRKVLGEGKLISPGEDKIAEIEHLFANDPHALAAYNLQDTVLVTRLFEKAGLFDFLTRRTAMTGVPLEKQHHGAEMLDFLLLPRLHRMGIAAPNPPQNPAPHKAVSVESALPFHPGVHASVIAFGFRDLVAKVIRDFGMDPLSREAAERDPENALSLSGSPLRFHRKVRPLAEVLEKIRTDFRIDDADPAYSSILNQVRQGMESAQCRFYAPSIVNAARPIAARIVGEAVSRLRDLGALVVEASLEGIHASFTAGDPGAGKAGEIAKSVGEALGPWIRETFGVESAVSLEVAARWDRMVLPPRERLLGEKAPNGLRYAALRAGSGEVVLHNLVPVRYEWPALLDDFLREIAAALFGKENPGETIRRVREDLKTGRLDERLLFSRKVRRELSEYGEGKDAPAYVVAARKLEKMPLTRTVVYRMNEAGAEPLGRFTGKSDAAWYSEKVLLPASELLLLGTAYAEACETLRKPEVQLSLF